MNAFRFYIALISVAFALIISSSLQAQEITFPTESKHELKLGYGLGSAPSLGRHYEPGIGEFIPLPTIEPAGHVVTQSSGVFSLAYTYHINDRFFIGIEGQYEQHQVKRWDHNPDPKSQDETTSY